MATETRDFNDLPLRVDIRVTQGDSYKKLWKLQYNPSGTATDIDLTNATMKLTISTAQGGTSLVSITAEITDWTTSSGIYIDIATEGEFTVFIIEGDTETTLGAGEFWYEVEMIFTDGDSTFPNITKTVLEGLCIVQKGAVG